MSRDEIRVARRDDLPSLLALLFDDQFSSERGGLDAASAGAAFDEIERDPNNAIHVLVRDGRVIGCAQLTVIPGLSRRGARRGLIEAVRIASDLRGAGLGGVLMRAVIAEAERQGCQIVQLTSDKRRTEAHRFYGALGFTATHEGFKRDLREPQAG